MVEEIHRGLIFIGIVEGRWVFCHESVDLGSYAVIDFIEPAAFDVFVNEHLKVFVIACEVFLVFEEGVEKAGSRERRIDCVVDHARAVA